MNDVLELTEQDQADLDTMWAEPSGEHHEPPAYHTLLEVWREVLRPIDDERTKPPTAQWCSRTISAYQGIGFADMYKFRDCYFDSLQELREILLEEISSDPECLTWASPEEDVEHNGHHYLNLLLQWQLTIQEWELAWDCTDVDAAIKLGAIGEVYKLVFGQTGITAYLDNIRFEFTESDQELISSALQDLRGEQ